MAVLRRWWGTVKYGRSFPLNLLFPLGPVRLKRDRASLCRWYAMLLKPGKLNLEEATAIVARSIESQFLCDRLQYVVQQLGSTKTSKADAIRDAEVFDGPNHRIPSVASADISHCHFGARADAEAHYEYAPHVWVDQSRTAALANNSKRCMEKTVREQSLGIAAPCNPGKAAGNSLS